MIKKKIFPKFKKKLSWFLTDESGKVAKKDVLGLSIGGLLLWSVDNVTLADHADLAFWILTHSNYAGGHTSVCSSSHVSQAAVSGYESWGHSSGKIAGASFSETKSWGGHISAIVNGSATLTGPSWVALNWVIEGGHSSANVVWALQSQWHASGYVGHSSSTYPAQSHANVDSY